MFIWLLLLQENSTYLRDFSITPKMPMIYSYVWGTHGTNVENILSNFSRTLWNMKRQNNIYSRFLFIYELNSLLDPHPIHVQCLLSKHRVKCLRLNLRWYEFDLQCGHVSSNHWNLGMLFNFFVPQFPHL